MKIAETSTGPVNPSWPKLGPAVLIATAMVVAIRTARWSTKVAGGAQAGDADRDLDKEVDFAVGVTDQVLIVLLKRRAGMFPQRREPVAVSAEESTPMRKLPVVIFIVTLLIALGLSYRQHQETRSAAIASEAQVQSTRRWLEGEVARSREEELARVEDDLALAASSNSRKSQGVVAVLHREKSMAGDAKEGQGAKELPRAQTEPEAVGLGAKAQEGNAQAAASKAVAPAGVPAKAVPFTAGFVMQGVFSCAICCVALFVILAKRYGATDKHWAYATVGTILGFWLKSAS